jgi:DNA-directed RNA polymerase subunit RPC12/RpoP
MSDTKEHKFKADSLTNEIHCPWCDHKWSMWDDGSYFRVDTELDDEEWHCPKCGGKFWLTCEPVTNWNFICRYKPADEWE